MSNRPLILCLFAGLLASCHRTETAAAAPSAVAQSPALSASAVPAQTASTVQPAEPAADEQVLLKGVISTADEQRFLLSNSTGMRQKWEAIGDEYAGWKLAEYRPAPGVLVLKRADGRELDLNLSSSKTGDGGPTPATLADAQRLLERMNFAQMFGKIIENQRALVAKSIAAQVKGIKGTATDEEAADFQKQVVDKLWSGVDNTAMNATVAKIYSREFTADQLNDIGNFYTTPTGQTAIAKTPEISAQISAALIAQIQSTNPQAIAMMKAFQQAHRAAAPAK